ncbi:hypothetical protein EON65_56075, partial [archaeon]
MSTLQVGKQARQQPRERAGFWREARVSAMTISNMSIHLEPCIKNDQVFAIKVSGSQPLEIERETSYSRAETEKFNLETHLLSNISSNVARTGTTTSSIASIPAPSGQYVELMLRLRIDEAARQRKDAGQSSEHNTLSSLLSGLTDLESALGEVSLLIALTSSLHDQKGLALK